MNWAELPLLGFDTETTGVDVWNCRVVTAALVLRRPGESDQVRTWLADPGVPIPEQASNIHGITTEYAQAHGRPIKEVLDEVIGELAKATEAGVTLVAFNGMYDLQILNQEALRHGIPTLHERLGGQFTNYVDPLVLDRGLDKWRKGKRTLSDLINVYNIAPRENLHTAEVDVQATLDVLEAQLERFPQLRDQTLPELFDWQRQAHRDWAVGLNEFLQSRGKKPDVQLEWPIKL